MEQGLSAEVMKEQEAASCIPMRPRHSHKGDYGYVALVGGSLPYSGAPRLAAMANAAMGSGAGVAVAAAPKSLCPLLAPLVLESTLFPLSETRAGHLAFRTKEWEDLCRRVKTMAFGMGIGRSKGVPRALQYVLTHFQGRLLIDADGLFALGELGLDALRQSRAQVLLTPHLGEASRLLGEPVQTIEQDPPAWAAELARRGGCTVLLKGADTVVTDGRETWIVSRGCPGMATAGSGDVLSGVLAALMAYGLGSLPKIGAAGAYLCGMAGEAAQEEWGPTAMTASDTVSQIKQAVRQLESVREKA